MTRSSPLPLTFRQLQYLVAVVDTNSFRKAAARCGVSQPALSAQIAALEDALGVQLLERDRRSVRLTSAGALVCERARRLLVDADDLAEIAKRLSDPLVRDLHVGVIPTISPYLLPEVVPSLRRDLPGLTLFWTEDQTNVLLKKLQDGELDAALLALETRLGDFETEELARDPFVLAMASSHLLAKKKGPVRISDIAGMDLLLLDDGHCLRDQALAACKTARAHELDFRATSLSTLVQMVSAGSGVTLLPRLALPVETRRSDLALRAFAKPAPYRTLGLIWRRGSAHAEALRKVAASIRAVARKVEPKLEKYGEDNGR